MHPVLFRRFGDLISSSEANFKMFGNCKNYFSFWNNDFGFAVNDINSEAVIRIANYLIREMLHRKLFIWVLLESKYF